MKVQLNINSDKSAEASVHANGTYVETARKLSRPVARLLSHLLASLLRNDRASTVFLPATTGKPLSKSDKTTNTIDNYTYDYDFFSRKQYIFYAATNSYLKSADLIM